MKKILILILIAALFGGCASNNSDISDSSELKTTMEILPTAETTTEVPFTEIEFNGLTSESDFSYGNLSINNKTNSAPSLFCSANEEIYFSNPSDNGYIYKLNNGSAELVLEKRACNINYYNDKLYFTSSVDELDDISYSGQVFCYDLNTKTCELFIEDNVQEIIASDEGIYYSSIVSSNENSSVVQLNFTDYSGNAQKCAYPYPLRYGNYVLNDSGAYDITDDIYTLSADKCTPYSLQTSFLYVACVYDDKLINCDTSGIELLDLKSGKRSFISRKEIDTFLSFSDYGIADFTLINESLYMTVEGSMIFQINLTNNEVSLIHVDGEEKTVYKQLYTDGEKLFAIKYDTRTSKTTLVELVKTETENGPAFNENEVA